MKAPRITQTSGFQTEHDGRVYETRQAAEEAADEYLLSQVLGFGYEADWSDIKSALLANPDACDAAVRALSRIEPKWPESRKPKANRPSTHQPA